jgi:hypothetical protein
MGFRYGLCAGQSSSHNHEKHPQTITFGGGTFGTYLWHYAFGQVAFSWQPLNPDSSVGLPDGEVLFITPKKVFPLLQSPMVASFTPLQPMLGIAHGNLRLVCGCSTMEANFMKLPKNSYCADVASRGSFELSSETFTLQLSAVPFGVCMVNHFAAEPLLLRHISTSQ